MMLLKVLTRIEIVHVPLPVRPLILSCELTDYFPLHKPLGHLSSPPVHLDPTPQLHAVGAHIYQARSTDASCDVSAGASSSSTPCSAVCAKTAGLD